MRRRETTREKLTEVSALQKQLTAARSEIGRLRKAQHGEAALRESEERYRRLFEDDLTGDYLATPDGRILDCNPAFVTILGFANRDDALATSMRALYPEVKEHAAFVAELRVRGKLEHYECVRIRRDGVPIHVVENAVGMLDKRGELLQIRGYLFDNTAAKLAERALREAEERYRNLIEFLPDAVLVSDEKERVLFANPAAARLVGARAPQELIGRSALGLFHASHHDAIRARTERALQDGLPAAPERRKIIRLDKSALDVETAVTPIHFDEKACVLRVNRDVTARVQAEETLLEKDREISLQLQKIEKLNAALTTLLEHREQETQQKLEGVRATLEKLVLAYLENLKSTPLAADQRMLVEVMEANLRNVASSFVRQLESWKMKLTPTEVQVADLLRLGKRTKEIAALLKVSSSAIAFHRNSIRTKLGLIGKPFNLVSYLRTMAGQ